MLDLSIVVPKLRASLKLQSPEVETDEAYKFEDAELGDILTELAPAHNDQYTIENFPVKETYFLMLLAKKEVYFRLATSSAPFYPIKAEGAELRKDVRFEHYMTLVRAVSADYDKNLEKFSNNQEIEAGEVLIQSRHQSKRNYRLGVVPEVALLAITTRNTSVDIGWTKFIVQAGRFYKYDVYVHTDHVYDEFEDKIAETATLVATIRDIHRLKYRLTNLIPNTHYVIAVISWDTNMLKGIAEVEIDTLV